MYFKFILDLPQVLQTPVQTMQSSNTFPPVGNVAETFVNLRYAISCYKCGHSQSRYKIVGKLRGNLCSIFLAPTKIGVNDTCLLHVLLLHAYKQGALMTDSFRARCSNDRQFHFKEEKVNL